MAGPLFFVCLGVTALGGVLARCWDALCWKKHFERAGIAPDMEAARMQNATAVPRDGGSGVPAVRNLDPRMKLLIVLVVGSAALFSPHRALLLWCYAIIAALWLLSGEARRALGFVAVLAAVALAEWGAGSSPTPRWRAWWVFFFIFARSLSTFALISGCRWGCASMISSRRCSACACRAASSSPSPWCFATFPRLPTSSGRSAPPCGCAVCGVSARNLVLHPGRSLEVRAWCRSSSAPSKSPTIWPLPAMTRGLDLWVRARRTATCASERRGARDGGGARLYGGRLCRVGGERAMTANEVVVAGATVRYAHDGCLRCAASTCARGRRKLVLLLGASGAVKPLRPRLLNGLVPISSREARSTARWTCGYGPASRQRAAAGRRGGGRCSRIPRSQFFATDVIRKSRSRARTSAFPRSRCRRRVAEAAGACGRRPHT